MLWLCWPVFIHPLATALGHDDEDAAAIVRVGAALDEPAGHEPVDSVRHRAARHQGLLQERLGAQLVGGAGATKSRKHVEFPELKVGGGEGRAPRALEVASEPADAREHLKRREIEVGSLVRPRIDDPVDFVMCGHPSIIARAGAARPFVVDEARRIPQSGRLDRAQKCVVRLGVMAARQPLELLGLGSSPGGGANSSVLSRELRP